MAENKRSFLLYTDVHFTVKKLTDEQSGKLFKHILSYVNDENPVTNDVILDLVFEPIKQALKRDLKRYEAICLRNKDNGSKGGRPKSKPKKPKKPSGIITNPNNPDGSRNNPNNPDEPDNDIDIDIDNVNEDNKVSAKKAEMDFIDRIVQIFVEVHGDYLIVNNGIERAAAGKLLKIYKNKYPGATSEETLAALKEYFLSCINIPDDWLRTNMSLPTIISKFNQINKILKNGTKKSGATYADIARITYENFPEQFNKG